MAGFQGGFPEIAIWAVRSNAMLAQSGQVTHRAMDDAMLANDERAW